MTALNWFMDETAVVAAADTLVVRADTREPLHFVTKIFPIPHARTIIAGTGAAQVVSHAAFTVACQSVCRDVEDVAQNLQSCLLEISLQMPVGPTSTIYVLGWAEDAGRMRGFTFRSGTDFEPEEMVYGFGIRPAMTIEYPRAINQDFFVQLILRQKEVEESKTIDAEDRVEIGGEIVLAQLTCQELRMMTIHRFDDYPALFNQAVEGSSSNLWGS